jgi:tetratricopeptide (TPR) repeat protein
MLFKTYTLIFLIFILAGGFLAAQADATVMVDAFRDEMYLQRLSDDELYLSYRILRADLAEMALDPREKLFQSARAAYYLGRVYQSPDSVDEVPDLIENLRRGKFKNIQKSFPRLTDIISSYEEALVLVSEYLEGGRDARGVRLYAEALSQLSSLKTLGFLVSNGSKIQPLAEEAVSLNQAEIKAHLLLSSRYVYSPAIWGGDPDRGIAMLEDISRIKGADREDRHNIAFITGLAHTMADRWDVARPYFQKALEIYPGNVYAAAMVEMCERNTP